MIRRWWRRWRARRADSGEICHEVTCLRELRWCDLWESRVHFANNEEMGSLGGTYMTASWCPDHAPGDAVRWRP